jgi:hypothetical protein
MAHWCKQDSFWRVRRSRGTHVRGASCAASVAIMRTALSVEWTRYGVVDPSARRQCQRLCTASRVDRSRQRQSEPRSAVLAALPQLQGPTEVPNMQRTVAHCHLVVVGGHVESSTASGWRQRPKCEKQRFCRRVAAPSRHIGFFFEIWGHGLVTSDVCAPGIPQSVATTL